jgi:type II secretory pathway pseudopilin PulG
MRTYLNRPAPRGVPGGRPPGSAAADRGSLTIFVVVFAITALALASLLVDLGNAVNAQERAADLAQQAARAAADTIDTAALRTGVVQIDTTTACANAQQVVSRYDSISGVNAAMTDCTFQGPRQATVFVSVTTTPIITTAFGSFTMKAHESACAEFGIDQGVGC